MGEVVEWDLRSWKPVMTVQSSDRISPGFLTRHLHLTRKDVTRKRVQFEFSTQGIGVDPICTDAEMEGEIDRGSNVDCVIYSRAEGELIQTWLGVDLPEAQPDQEIHLEVRATFWNSFQNPSLEWAGFTARSDGARQSFRVLFPEARGFRQIEKYICEDINVPNGCQLEESSRRKTVEYQFEWKVHEPTEKMDYVVVWNWSQSVFDWDSTTVSFSAREALFRFDNLLRPIFSKRLNQLPAGIERYYDDGKLRTDIAVDSRQAEVAQTR